jgi:glycerophosphoryl diester phosphodiesterase
MSPLIVGHRGNARYAPENTCVSFAQAIEAGATMVEMDTRLSKDGQIVLMHDETIDRTTNAKGNLADLMSQELARLDAGSWKDPKYHGEPVPTLTQVAEVCRDKAIMMLDLKCRGQGPAISQWVILAPWDMDEGIALARLLPGMPRVLICEDPPPDLAELKHLGFDGFSIDHQVLQQSFVSAARSLGLKVYTWTVNEPTDLLRVSSFGVDGIITDAPGLARHVLGA